MTNWVGGIGDRRVIRIDDLKIYTSPYSAAYAINFSNPGVHGSVVRPDDIIVNCNRFVKGILNGMRFEWYNQYLLDHGSKDFQSPPEFVLVERPITNRELAQKNRQGIKSFYADVKKIYRAVKKTYLNNPELIGISMSIPSFLEAIGIDRKSSAAFSRHFRVHKDTYEELFGAEFSTMYSAKSSKEVMSIKLTKFTNIGSNENVDSDFEIVKYFSKHHDERSSYTKGISSSGSQAVVRLEDMKVFGSLNTASELTGIEKSKILWCCNGDIPYCKKWATKHTFRFAKFKETRNGN